MHWDEIPGPWQAAFDEAWAGYCAGSLPIGSVITDREDNVLFQGRNRLYEGEAPPALLAGNHLAHAEMNAMAPLRPEVVDAKKCVLYTTMEPCPMCTGAIRMIGVGAVHFAARDPVAGSISLLEATPFMRRGGITTTGPAFPVLETFSVAIVVAAFLQIHGGSDLPVRIMSNYQPLLPDAVRLGQLIFDTGMLNRMRDAGSSVGEVYNAVLTDLQTFA